ncbi:MAG: 50S ribosomal protein L22 [Elusimicrobiota bacterium]|jgi:large subunit ribosomal protein L22|nr:MAG: 50S ribosomal protein L22 [Elusimicrobiota bacterium]
MEATAYSRFQRYGTRKVGQVLKEIRGKSVLEAERLLPMMPRICSVMVSKAVRSAAANLVDQAAKAGHQVDPSKVYIKSCWSTMGPMGHMKRMLPAPQGRAYTFKRKVCHLTVVVSDERVAGKRK